MVTVSVMIQFAVRLATGAPGSFCRAENAGSVDGERRGAGTVVNKVLDRLEAIPN